MAKQLLFSVPELKARGWTDGLIRTFMPEPDDTRPNPRFRHAGSPMRLYRRSRVLRIEGTEKFAAAKGQTGKRQAAASKAVATKRAATALEAAAMEFDVPVIDREELIQRAWADYRAEFPQGSAELTDERVCVNYLRHCCTRYHQQLELIHERVGHDSAYVVIKDAVLDVIAERYEWLLEECARQSAETSRRG